MPAGHTEGYLRTMTDPGVQPVRSDAMTTETSVLVVDDEPQVVWMLRFSLEAAGYRVLSAREGHEALESVREHQPDLMLLDIMMPVMDGWSVLQHLQELPERDRPKVVVLSARTGLRDRAKAAELGADAFVPKPFNVDDLLEVMSGLEPVDEG